MTLVIEQYFTLLGWVYNVFYVCNVVNVLFDSNNVIFRPLGHSWVVVGTSRVWPVGSIVGPNGGGELLSYSPGGFLFGLLPPPPPPDFFSLLHHISTLYATQPTHRTALSVSL